MLTQGLGLGPWGAGLLLSKFLPKGLQAKPPETQASKIGQLKSDILYLEGTKLHFKNPGCQETQPLALLGVLFQGFQKDRRKVRMRRANEVFWNPRVSLEWAPFPVPKIKKKSGNKWPCTGSFPMGGI